MPRAKKSKVDCVVTAVANAIGVAYQAVSASAGKFPPEGLGYKNLIELMKHFGQWKQTNPARSPTIEEWLRRHKAGQYILVMASGFVPGCHALAAVDGDILGQHDPSWPIASYFTLLSEKRYA
ncbi:MAG: hypothetical protein ACJ8C4_14055 [Gemmataceae bacterium]